MLAMSEIATPWGSMTLVHDQRDCLWVAAFGQGRASVEKSLARFRIGPLDPEPVPVPDAIGRAFERYCAGEVDALDQLAVGQMGSPFEQAVWVELRKIPAGQTRSYSDIARALGGAASGSGPNARAVGMANGRNPVAVAIPCHRVIGANGSLTGYAGGLEIKRQLLLHEGWRPAQETMF